MLGYLFLLLTTFKPKPRKWLGIKLINLTLINQLINYINENLREKDIVPIRSISSGKFYMQVSTT